MGINDWLTTSGQRRPEGVGFYGGPFSNFVGGPFEFTKTSEADILDLVSSGVDLEQWDGSARTVEHIFQACKATTTKAFLHILAASGPGEAKRRGRQCAIRPDWTAVRYEVMRRALLVKFAPGSEWAYELIATGDRFIFEDSPTDAIWGLWDPMSLTWSGENLLGKALMEVRDMLQRGGESDE